MPRLRPYSVPRASSTTSSRLEKGVTGATGPKTSSRYAGAPTGPAPRRRGRAEPPAPDLRAAREGRDRGGRSEDLLPVRRRLDRRVAEHRGPVEQPLEGAAGAQRRPAVHAAGAPTARAGGRAGARDEGGR